MGVGAGQGPDTGLADGDLFDATRAVGALGDHDGQALLQVGGRNGSAAEVARHGVRGTPKNAEQAPDPEPEAHPGSNYPFLGQIGQEKCNATIDLREPRRGRERLDALP